MLRLNKLLRASRIIIISALIGLMIMMSAIRLVLSMTDKLQPYIETQIAAKMERPVTIERLQARLSGLTPEIVLYGVSVLDANQAQTLLNFKEIRVTVDLIQSILSWNLRPKWVSVVGARFSARSELDGSFSIVGLQPMVGSPAWLFEEGRFELIQSDIHWQDIKGGGPILNFSSVDIVVQNDDGQHTIDINLNLPHDLGHALRLNLDYTGNIFNPNCCTGRMYADGKVVQLAKFFEGQSALGFKFQDGTGNFQLWSEWKDSQMHELAGNIELHRTQLSRTEPVLTQLEDQLLLQQVEGWFRWRNEENKWSLDAKKFSMTLNDKPWPLSRFSIVADGAGDSEEIDIRIGSSYANLADVGTLLATSNWLDDQQQNVIQKLSPTGTLYDFGFIYGSSKQEKPHIYFCGGFADLSLKQWGKVSELTHLSGHLCGSEGQGELTLDTTDVDFTSSKYFRRSLYFDSIQGTLAWRQHADFWALSSKGFNLVTPDLSTRSRFKFKIPKTDESPLLDLHIDFNDGNASATSRYLPTSLMNKALVSWLDTAFLSGRVTNGGLLFYGPINQFPFYQKQGIFEILFRTDDIEFNYADKWPSLTELDAEVLFYGPSLAISMQQGKISGIRIERLRADIPHLNQSDYVFIKGRTHSDFKAAMNFVAQSPLKPKFAPFLDLIQAEGQKSIDLSLHIPLAEDLDEVIVEGVSHIDNARISIPNLGIDVENIMGNIQFDSNDLFGIGIQASVLNSPALIDIATKNDQLGISVISSVSANSLNQRFDQPWQDFATGQAAYQLDIKIPKSIEVDQFSAAFHLTSDLVGLELDLPQPFGKRKKIAQNLSLDLFVAEHDKVSIGFNYGNKIQGDLLFSESSTEDFRLEAGKLILGKLETEVASSPGLKLIAELDDLYLNEWGKLWALSRKAMKSSNSLSHIKIDIDHLYWQDRDLGNLSMLMLSEGNNWTGTIDANLAKGDLQFVKDAEDKSALTLDLDLLNLPSTEDQGTPADEFVLDPALFPDLRLTSQHLLWQSIDLGTLELKTTQRPDGLEINKFEIRSDQNSMAATGLWLREQRSDFSHLQGKLKIKKLGKFLKNLDFTDELKKTKAEFEFSLDWDGAPYQMSADNVSGHAKIGFDEGRLLGVDPGIGRVLGLLSLDTFNRRLHFDFSDLFGDGLAFDRVDGSFDLVGGYAQTQDLVIDAVSSRIDISGRIGLVNKDLDHTITVTPKATASLPIAGAIAGGPAVGAAIFVAQKIIGDNLDSLTSSQYAVKGNWKEPLIAELDGEGGLLRRAWSGLKDFPWVESADKKVDKKIEQEDNE